MPLSADTLRNDPRFQKLTFRAPKDARSGPATIVCLARIAAWIGDKDLACGQLAAAIQHSSYVSYGELKLMPWWDPLRGDPRFEQIVASLAPKGN